MSVLKISQTDTGVPRALSLGFILPLSKGRKTDHQETTILQKYLRKHMELICKFFGFFILFLRFGGARNVRASLADSSSKIVACSLFTFFFTILGGGCNLKYTFKMQSSPTETFATAPPHPLYNGHTKERASMESLGEWLSISNYNSKFRHLKYIPPSIKKFKILLLKHVGEYTGRTFPQSSIPPRHSPKPRYVKVN